MDRIDRRRPSLSPTVSTKRDFDQFMRDSDGATNDATVANTVMPHISGRENKRSAQGITFSNLQPFTTGGHNQPLPPPPTPTSYDGIDPSRIHPSLRSSYQSLITPSPSPSAPILPNWHQESRGPDFPPGPLRTAAVHNGALGARAMDTLNSHGRPNQSPEFDGQARTFGATYLDGTLNLYSTHTEMQSAWGGGDSYHTYRIASESMVGSIDQFRKGAARFRNLRDLAEEERERTVAGANRMRGVVRAGVGESGSSARKGDDEASPSSLMDYEISPAPGGATASAAGGGQASPTLQRTSTIRSRDDMKMTGEKGTHAPRTARVLPIVERLRGARSGGLKKTAFPRNDERYVSEIEEGYEPDDEDDDDDDDDDDEV